MTDKHLGTFHGDISIAQISRRGFEIFSPAKPEPGTFKCGPND